MRPCVRRDLGHGGTAAAPVSAARIAGVHGVQEFPRPINKEAVIGASPSPDGTGGLESGRMANCSSSRAWRDTAGSHGVVAK